MIDTHSRKQLFIDDRFIAVKRDATLMEESRMNTNGYEFLTRHDVFGASHSCGFVSIRGYNKKQGDST